MFPTGVKHRDALRIPPGCGAQLGEEGFLRFGSPRFGETVTVYSRIISLQDAHGAVRIFVEDGGKRQK